jgi:hypothetical protein
LKARQLFKGQQPMNEQNKNIPDNPSFVVAAILLLIIIFVSSVPVMIKQMDRPERLLPRTKAWDIIAKSTDQSVWEASDGFSVEHVSAQRTNAGFRVILHPTELATREAFFNEGLITKNTFKLSVEVNTPPACHNGLVFRGNAQGEYYLFLVSSCANTYTVEILRRESGQDLPREALIPNTPVSDSIGQPRTLTVIGRGEAYYFYINGIYVNEISDSRLNGSHVGVEVLKCDGSSEDIGFDFNNFVLASP